MCLEQDGNLRPSPPGPFVLSQRRSVSPQTKELELWLDFFMGCDQFFFGGFYDSCFVESRTLLHPCSRPLVIF